MSAKLEKLLREFPPVLCRLLARRNMSVISGRRLAVLSDLSRDKVDQISRLTSWDTVRVGDALKFMQACGVDILNARRQREFVRRANWQHIERTPNRKYYRKLLEVLYEARIKQRAV